MRSWSLPLAALPLAGATILSVAPAIASQGVAIDVGSIAIREELAPGGQYRLPPFGVRNPGTETTGYDIVVSYVDGQDQLAPPADWFQFDPARVTLEAGESRPVSARLEVPPGAEPGEYHALIGPRITPEREGAEVGAAAAARLTFTVRPSSWLEGALRWLWRELLERPWLWLGAVLLAVIAVAAVLRRRFTIRVVRRS